MFNPWMVWKIEQKGNKQSIFKILEALKERYPPNQRGIVEVFSNVDDVGEGVITIEAAGNDAAEGVRSFIDYNCIAWF